MKTIRLIVISTIVLIISCGSVIANNPETHEKKEPYKLQNNNNRFLATNHTFGLDLGFNNYLQDKEFPDATGKPYAVKPWGSWYVSINSTHITRILGPLHFNWGAGVSWYNFKFQNEAIQIKSGNNEVYFEEFTTPDAVPIKSKLTAAYLDAFLVPSFYFGNKSYDNGGCNFGPFDSNDITAGLRIGFGGYIGYKLDDYAKFVYKADGEKEKDHNKDNFYVNNWRYGLRFQIGFNDMDFFANYDLNELFLENKGPVLNAFSFGVSLY